MQTEIIPMQRPKSATEYWQQRKLRNEKRKQFLRPSEAQRFAAIRKHVCTAACGPVCTKFEW